MKKIAVIGHFAFGKEYLDGQTVKTKVLTQALRNRFGEDEILAVDTHGWSGNPIRFFLRVWQTAKQAENVVVLPAHNGLRVIIPLLHTAAKLHKKCRLHYVVIGGWLPRYLKNKNNLAKQLKAFAGIYVETNTMRKALQKVGFQNVAIMPNCKDLQILEPFQLSETEKPYKLCTFSRVMQEKGIEDAVAAVRAVNEARGETVYTLDIYGPVDSAQTQWFEDLQKTFPSYVRCVGAVPFAQSVEVLKDYFALLFPTRFYTEGIPGTVIDAYAAGVPVVTAKWESFADVIDNGQTGWGYEFGNGEALRQMLESIADKPEMVTALKQNCLKKAQDYTPEKAVEVLLQRMEG